jgi:SAM-dependent methyltransferase
MTDSLRSLSFGQVADEYDRWRPGYPDAAVDWLAPGAPARVADVGAGTGKLTSSLLARGVTVEAVEPDARMLAVLARNNPAARCHESDSTAIPVEDRSLDAVLVADAWHWFDAEATITEVRRVLKPGGWLGLVWNVVADPVEPWEFELAGESERFDRETKRDPAGLAGRLSCFRADELEMRVFPWTWELTPEHRASSLATTSMLIAMDPPERAERVHAAYCELRQICETAGTASMPIRSEASCVRWTPGPQV